MVKEQGVEYVEGSGKKRSFGRNFLFLLFLLVIGSLVFFAYGSEINLTGHFINIGGINEEKAFDILARLEELNETLEINQDIESITLDLTGKNGNLVLNKKTFISLEGIESPKILIEGFSGRLILDKDFIVSFSGEADKLILNNIPVSGSEGPIKFSLSEQIGYSSILVSGVYLRKYEGNALDRVEAKGKTFFDLKGEPVIIEKFSGDILFGEMNSLGIKNRGLEFEGLAEELKIKGEINIDFEN